MTIRALEYKKYQYNEVNYGYTSIDFYCFHRPHFLKSKILATALLWMTSIINVYKYPYTRIMNIQIEN